MKPDNHEIIDRLASEYVLGTLRGSARRRFWEERLMRLAKGLTPVQPPAHVWTAIQRRLNLTAPGSVLRRMRAFAMAASIVLVVGLAGLLYWRGVHTVRATVVATISAKS